MTEVFVDASVLAVACGAEHPDREACLGLIVGARRGEFRVHVSVEAIRELVFHRMRRGDRDLALEQSRAMRAMCVMHDFDDEVLGRSLDLIASMPIRARDAVHAATALEGGFDEIISLDENFDSVPGLRRRHPRDIA